MIGPLKSSLLRYEGYINVRGSVSTSRSITVALEVKENLMKHTFITNFISDFLMNQTYLFCFYTCDIITSNE